MIIEVYSLDFDGCLANYKYLSTNPKDILAANKELLDTIKLSPHKKWVYIGSNRQSLADDFSNGLADERGSCYLATQLISQIIEALFDDFLLSDIYNDLPDGTAFKHALSFLSSNRKDYTAKKLSDIEGKYNWILDKGKLSILYAQIHRMSLAHPDDEIHFNFLDDRKDILDDLHTYFSKYPELIPKNVTLNLKLYKGSTDPSGAVIDPLITAYPPIQGKGKADKHYRQTIKEMAAVTIEGMAKVDNHVSSLNAKGLITNYAQVKDLDFDISEINVLKHYRPGMTPKNKIPKEEKKRKSNSSTMASSSAPTASSSATIASPSEEHPVSTSTGNQPLSLSPLVTFFPPIVPPSTWQAPDKSKLVIKETKKTNTGETSSIIPNK